MHTTKLVYHELTNGLPIDMLADKKLLIISDSSIFIITTQAHAKYYNYKFIPVPIEAMKEYNIVLENGIPKQLD